MAPSTSQYRDRNGLSSGIMLDVKAWDDQWFESLTGENGASRSPKRVFSRKQNKRRGFRVIGRRLECRKPRLMALPQPWREGRSDVFSREKFRRFGVRGPWRTPFSSVERMQAIVAGPQPGMVLLRRGPRLTRVSRRSTSSFSRRALHCNPA